MSARITDVYRGVRASDMIAAMERQDSRMVAAGGVRRPADAKPGEFGKRLVGNEAPARLRRARFQVGGDVGEGHAAYPSAFSSPGNA